MTVAKDIEFGDRYHNIGAQLVKGVASRTNDNAGDGTTTATVLARAIFAEGCKSVAAGINPMGIRRGIEMAVKEVVKDLQSRSQDVGDRDQIKSVATISANGDEEIGELLASAMDRVGKEGTITI